MPWFQNVDPILTHVVYPVDDVSQSTQSLLPDPKRTAKGSLRLIPTTDLPRSAVLT